MSVEDERFVFRSAGEGARGMEAQAAEGRSDLRRFAERVFDVRTDERAWRRGAVGEEKVGRTLAKLPPGWAVVHDLTIGSRGANLDHLVIGPPGVFTLNTKNLTGTVTVYERAILHNGSKTRFLAEARRERDRVSAALSRAVGRDITVRPAIVLAGSADLQVKGRPGDVTILHRLGLRRWLRKQSESLDLRTIELLEGAARAVSTWSPPPRAGSQADPEVRPRTVVEPEPSTPPAPPTPETVELVVQPWKRFGHDRCYVDTAAGDSLGYLDRLTGTVHVAHEHEHDRPRVAAALRAAGYLP